jgi:hypothetical protein
MTHHCIFYIRIKHFRMANIKITGQGLLLNEDQQKPNQLELDWLQNQDLDPISLLTDTLIQKHITFTNTVVISWILMPFLKKHFHIFQYITLSFWYIVPAWLCGAQQILWPLFSESMEKPCTLSKSDNEGSWLSFNLTVKKRRVILSCFSATTFLTHLLYSH